MLSNMSRRTQETHAQRYMHQVLRYGAAITIVSGLSLGLGRESKADTKWVTFQTACGQVPEGISFQNNRPDLLNRLIEQKRREAVANCNAELERRREALENARREQEKPVPQSPREKGNLAMQPVREPETPAPQLPGTQRVSVDAQDLENARSFCDTPYLYIMPTPRFNSCLMLAQRGMVSLDYYRKPDSEACAPQPNVALRNQEIGGGRFLQASQDAINEAIWRLSKSYQLTNDNLRSKVMCGDVPFYERIPYPIIAVGLILLGAGLVMLG
jgi:hypothetical protein